MLLPYNSLLGNSLEQVVEFFNNKGIDIDHIKCTRPTKVKEDYKNKRVVRIKETKKDHSVEIVFAMFPDFNF